MRTLCLLLAICLGAAWAQTGVPIACGYPYDSSNTFPTGSQWCGNYRMPTPADFYYSASAAATWYATVSPKPTEAANDVATVNRI